MGRMDLVVCPSTGKQQVSNILLSSCMLTDTNLYVCVGRDYNKALPSGLIALDWTRQLLEIDVAEHDFRVALSKENLWLSQLWSSVEVEKGISIPPLDLIFPLLRL